MEQLTSIEDVDRAVSGGTAILYKHSTRCPISAAAHEEMQHFLERHPDAPFYVVDVNASPEASRHVETKSGVRHQSPQLILFRDGAVSWTVSHFDITADAVEEEFDTGAG